MSVAEDTGGTGLANTKSAGDLLRLPPSPITSDQAGGAAPQARFADTSKSVQPPKKRLESTHLPTVLQDVASLEHERARLTQELTSLRETHQAVTAKLKEAEEHKLRQLEVMGKYDRFFLNDKGQHPLGRHYAVQQTAITIQKYVSKLENQKMKLLTKVNQSVDANNAVKTRIDVLRREGVVFRELFAKMEAELQGLKKEISSNKSQLESAFEARDAAQYEMLEIQEELKLTKADFEAELQATAAAANVAVPDTSASLNMSMFDSGVMGSVNGGSRILHRTRSVKGVDRNSSAMRKLSKQQKFKQMEEDWKAIMDATGMASAEELVAFFKDAEVQRFSKAKAITELVSEVARTERELKQFADATLDEIHERKSLADKHNTQVKMVDAETEALKRSTEDTRQELSGILSEFEDVLPVVHSAFMKIGCEKMFAHAEDAQPGQASDVDDVSKPQLPAMFSAPSTIQSIRSGISVHNLPLFLGVIEHRAAEIMQQYTALFPKGKTEAMQARAAAAAGGPSMSTPIPSSLSGRFRDRSASPTKEFGDAKFKAGTLGPSEPTGAVKLVIQSSALRAAMLDPDRDESDECDRPLTRAELEARAVAMTTKPQAEATKSAAIAAAVVLTSSLDTSLRHKALSAVL